MFKKRKSKRRALASAKGSGKQKGAVEAPKLWELSASDADSLLRLVPLLVAKLERDGLEEALLFLRKPAVDGSSEMQETVVEAYEEFVLQQKVVQEVYATKNKSEVLDRYGCHTWASVIKAILSVQSRKKLLSVEVAKDILSVADLPEERSKVDAAKAVLEHLPHTRYEVLSSLCRMLHKCATPNAKLAFVFGNSILLGDREEDVAYKAGSKRLLKVAEACTETMDLLITEAHCIFHGATLAAETATATATAAANGKEVEEEEERSVEEDREGCLANVKVLYDYTPVEEDELALVADEWVEVLSRANDDWLEGRYYDEEGVEHRGIFPESYCDMSTYEAIGVGDHDEIVTIDDDSDSAATKKVVAIYAYEAQEDVELALEAGQVLTLVDSSDEDWWRGTASDGKTGLFPKAYVRMFEGEDELNPSRSVDLSKSAEEENDSNVSTLETVNSQEGSNNNRASQDEEQEHMESSGTDQSKKAPGSSPPPVPAPRAKRRTKRRPAPPPKPPPELRSTSYGNAEATPLPKHKPPSVAAQHRATSYRGVLDRPLLHSPHAPVTRSAIPANRPPPVIRGPGSIDKIQVDSAARGGIQYSGPPVVSGLSKQTETANMTKAVEETRSWKIDQARFEFCVDWFRKLAKVGIGGELRVSGKDVAGFLLQSGLDKGVVARILELSDIDRDKEFDRDEFVVAHHLAISIKSGMPEPTELPSYLIPSSKRQTFNGKIQ